MNYLLDTQIIIWVLREEKRLPGKIIDILDNPKNRFFISIVSLWEASIKISMGKLELAKNFIDELIQSEAIFLPVTPEHIKTLQILPLHHKDPFDRMLIAQAIHENLPLISSDRHFTQYDAKIILA